MFTVCFNGWSIHYNIWMSRKLATHVLSYVTGIHFEKKATENNKKNNQLFDVHGCEFKSGCNLIWLTIS